MNTNKFVLSGLVALALSAIAANAAVLPGSDVGGVSDLGDLTIGFRNSTQTADFVVDIGQYTAYEGVAPGTYTIAGFNVTDLTNAFGADATNGGFGTATRWGVFGGSGGEGLPIGDSVNWVTSNTALPRASAPSQAPLSSQFDTFVNTQLATLGGVSGDSAVLSNKAWTSQLSPASNYGTFATAVDVAANGTSSIKLWELLPGSGDGTLLGTFTLSQASGLTFTVAIPEPSTYAALLGVVTLGIVAIRRRRQASLEMAA